MRTKTILAAALSLIAPIARRGARTNRSADTNPSSIPLPDGKFDVKVQAVSLKGDIERRFAVEITEEAGQTVEQKVNLGLETVPLSINQEKNMKKSSLSLNALILTTVIALVGSPLFAGVVFQVETTYHSGSPGVESSQMSVETPNLKMEIQPRKPGDVKDEVIFNGDRRQMVVVDHRDKTYMVIDGDAVQKLGGQMQGQMQQAMKELEKKMEGLDPKQREMMEKMLKGKMPAQGAAPGASQRLASEFKRTSERATKQGYPCVKYDVLRGGEKVRETWVTDWSNVKGGQDVVDSFKGMASFYGELMDSFEDMMGDGGGFFDAAQNPIESYTKIDGFPVVTRSFEGGELESETVLESVTERDLDPAAFEPPKGYRLRTMGPQ